jgi:hypothetical protein
MPTIFSVFGLRFLFFSDDHEPVHVHVAKGRGAVNESAVFQIEPNVQLVKNKGLSLTELKLAENLIEENRELILLRWKSFFDQK